MIKKFIKYIFYFYQFYSYLPFNWINMYKYFVTKNNKIIKIKKEFLF